MDKKLYKAALRAAAAPRTDKEYDFDREVSRSFLPLMIRILKEHDIRFAFIRMKRSKEKIVADPRLDAYIRSLEAYLNEHDVPFIDFATEERILPEYYGSGDHMNRRGRNLFTKILVERLGPYLEADKKGQE